MQPSDVYKPRAWRWLNVKQAARKSLVKVVDKEGLPQGFTVRRGRRRNRPDASGGYSGEGPDPAGNQGAYFAPTKLEIGESVVIYYPERFAEATGIRPGRSHDLEKVSKLERPGCRTEVCW